MCACITIWLRLFALHKHKVNFPHPFFLSPLTNKCSLWSNQTLKAFPGVPAAEWARQPTFTACLKNFVLLLLTAKRNTYYTFHPDPTCLTLANPRNQCYFVFNPALFVKLPRTHYAIIAKRELVNATTSGRGNSLLPLSMRHIYHYNKFWISQANVIQRLRSILQHAYFTTTQCSNWIHHYSTDKAISQRKPQLQSNIHPSLFSTGEQLFVSTCIRTYIRTFWSRYP